MSAFFVEYKSTGRRLPRSGGVRPPTTSTTACVAGRQAGRTLTGDAERIATASQAHPAAHQHSDMPMTVRTNSCSPACSSATEAAFVLNSEILLGNSVRDGISRMRRPILPFVAQQRKGCP